MAASFPTSIKSFTTKVDNVTDVLAAHVNDIQDEVVAIETALGAGFAGSVVKYAYEDLDSVVTCSTVIPYDDTAPLITEGDQIIEFSYTPLSASNKLLYLGVVTGSDNGGGDQFAVTLWEGSTLVGAVETQSYSSSGNFITIGPFIKTSPGTSPVSIQIRVGPASGVYYVNAGGGGVRIFNTTKKTSLLVLEIKA